jgi:hypothetical protein
MRTTGGGLVIAGTSLGGSATSLNAMVAAAAAQPAGSGDTRLPRASRALQGRFRGSAGHRCRLEGAARGRRRATTNANVESHGEQERQMLAAVPSVGHLTGRAERYR